MGRSVTGLRGGSHCARSLAPVMVGDALLELPRLHELLSRQGVTLVECSAELPHVVIDHEAGLLAFEAADMSQLGRVLAMVRRCEIAFSTLWLLVLLPDRRVAAGSGTAADPRAGSRRDLHAAVAWEHIRSLLAALASSPLKVRAHNIARWTR